MIKLIVFDLWQTLIYEDQEISLTNKFMQKMGNDFSKEDFIRNFKEITQTKKYNSDKEMYLNVCKKLKIKETQENLKKIKECFEESDESIKLYPYTIKLLKNLKEKGYEIGIISNSIIFSIDKLKQKTDLFEYIDYNIFSFEEGMLKPNLKIFSKIIEITAHKPSEIVVVGDDYYEDFIPSKEIGMYSIIFKNYEQLKEDFSKIGIFID